MSYLTDFQYYNNEGSTPTDENWGSYQYMSLNDIVTNFMLMYVGNDKLLNNVKKYEVRFHAKRAIQELHYDALREVKIVELSVCDDLKLILPYDYVNWVRVSLFYNGVMRPLQENVQSQFAQAHLQDNDCNILLDEDGNVLVGTSTYDYERITGTVQDQYIGSGAMSGRNGHFCDDRWYFNYPIGAKFGLNTSTANSNPTFSIDKASGVMNFSSSLRDVNDEGVIVLEYISDGMERGDDNNVVIHKFFEEYIYAYIEYIMLSTKLGVQEYVVRRKRNRKKALLTNAKIRISGIKPARMFQMMRGRDKWIK